MVTPGSGPILQALAVIAAGNGGECIEAVPGYGSVARGFQSFQMMGKDVQCRPRAHHGMISCTTSAP